MKRSIRVVTMIISLAAGAARSTAQPSSQAESSHAALEEAKQLTELAEKLYGEGKYAKAVVPAAQALALREKALKRNHPDVAESLDNLAKVYKAQLAYAKVEPLYARSLAIREQTLGQSHPDVAESLSKLARFYVGQGAYAKAEPLHTRALTIREQALGRSHRDVAESLNNLAELYEAQGAFAKAEPLHIRALAIREQTLGPNHPDVAESLHNLARAYRQQGAYAKAELRFTRALAIREQTLGPNHRDVAESLKDLAELFEDQGTYAKAEPLHTRALAIFERALGPSDPFVAVSLNSLAMLYLAQGAYAKAEPLYTRALTIFEKAVGPSHPHVASILGNLAELYRAQGAYAKAEPLYTRALAIEEKTLGPTHPNLATSLNNLALVYQAQGAYAKAEPLCTRALVIYEKEFGPGHPHVAASLNTLALVHQVQGAYAKAEPLYTRALAIQEKALGLNHPRVANSLSNLASLYRDQGAYATAEALYTRALAIREKALGPDHRDVATNLNNLADLYRAQGAYTKAEPLVARAADIQEQELRIELVRLSESRKRALMTLVQEDTEAIVSLHADAMPSSASALELGLTTILRRKARILDSMVDSDTRIRSHLNPQLRHLLEQLSQARSELVAQLYAPFDSPARAQVTATRARIDELESLLSAASAEFRSHVEPVTLAKVQAALPAGTALVELVRYRRFDPRQPRQPWQEERYIAYLLTARGAPRWVALGPAAPIDAQIDTALRAIHSKAPNATTEAELRRLDPLVLAPIRSQLSGVSHLIVAPEGKLNLVPFEALIDPQGRYALENYLISYVTTGRDLLRMATPQAPRSAAVIIAGPDYGPMPKARRPGTVAVAPLPGALDEATDLRRYFPMPPLIGDKATKAALATLQGPAMLHIATHGFYARDPGIRRLAPRHGARGMFVDRGNSQSPPPRRPDDLADALDRSGLAMAGANLGPSGIVTAREIAGLDWWGTQLVVLSACETGVGAVLWADGVHGLRRALVLVGAASQVVSLWSVSDKATPALMRDYYDRLAHGVGRAEALRQAKRELMSQPRYAHPYYWAAFIAAGDWRPLDKAVFHHGVTRLRLHHGTQP
jgi:CHAT domain-containing protein/tetratricopeptide (TPR) repeat protein